MPTAVNSAASSASLRPELELPFANCDLTQVFPGLCTPPQLRVGESRAKRLKLVRHRYQRHIARARARRTQREDRRKARVLATQQEALLGTASSGSRPHRIFFSVIVDGVSHEYAFYDSGCDRSLFSRPAFHALVARKGSPITEILTDIKLVGWFGSRSEATSKIRVRMKLGDQEKEVELLLVDSLDFDLVIGNDIFREVFQAGFKKGSTCYVTLPGGCKVPYSKSADPIRPDKNNEWRVPIQVSEHQVIPARSMAHVSVYLPPFENHGSRFAHHIGLANPLESFEDKNNIRMPIHLVKPLRVMRLVVFNYSPKRVAMKIGDICAYYHPILAQDVIAGDEAKVMAAHVRQEVARLCALQAEPTPSAASSSTSATNAPQASAASPSRTDASARLDPGVEGVAFDDRMEVPRNTPQGSPDAQIDPSFPKELRQKFSDTINECLLVADNNFAPTLSTTEPMKIELTKNVVINITRPLPLNKAKEADLLALDYAKFGVTRASTSAFNAPVVLVKKPDGSWRFCVDYRELNAITKRDAYQFPRISDMLDSLAGSKVFSTIDLAAGFHQLNLDEASKHYTAFSTLSGHWEFNRVTFGLTNSPPWLQRAVAAALRGIEWSICVVWMDDIIIHSRSYEQHIEDLKTVLLRLRERGFSVRLNKCHFGLSKIQYLGHVISEEGIAKSHSNVKDIEAAQPPKTVKELQRVLGLFNYYRRFVHQFAQLAKPLTRYLAGSPKPSTPIALDEEALQAFYALRAKLCDSDVILSYPDFSKEFVIETDASQHHIGAILSQRDAANRERPIAFWSQTLTERQSHWSAYKRELYALISACKEWRRYLQVLQCFTARFDQRAIQWILKEKEREPMLAGWVMQLEEFGINLVYQPGERHQHVDALTKGPINRNPYRHGGESDLHDQSPLAAAQIRRLVTSHFTTSSFKFVREEVRCYRLATPILQHIRLLSTSTHFNLKDLPLAQREDPEIRPYLDYLLEKKQPDLPVSALKTFLARAQSLEVREDNILYHTVPRGPLRESRSRRVAPRQARSAIMKAYHDDPTAGHFSFDKAYPRLADDWWWPSMLSDFRQHCQACPACGARNRPRNLADTTNLPGQLVNLPPLARPLERVAMDILGPLVDVDGYHYALVITDHFSRFVWLHKLKTQSAREIADHYLKTFQILGILPSIILTDRGAGFDQHLARAIAEAWAIDKRATSAYHPQCNGMPERFNQTIAAMLAKILEGKQEDWVKYLAPLAFAYNTAFHPSIGMSPITALTGISAVSPLIATLGRASTEPGYASPEEARDERARRLQEVWDIVKNSDRKTKERQKKDYDARHDTDVSYRVGAKVWLFTPHLGRNRKLRGYSRKLSSLWAGPYTVVSVHNNGVNYTLRNRHGKVMQQPIHIQRLKPYLLRPMPVGVPHFFNLQDIFDPTLEPEFDLIYNSDRYEPDVDAPETNWTLDDFGPPTSVEMADPAPEQVDFFASLPQTLAVPASPPAPPRLAPSTPQSTPLPEAESDQGAPDELEEDEADAPPASAKPTASPSPMGEEELRASLPQHALPLLELIQSAYYILDKDKTPASLELAIKAHNKHATFINNQLDLILPPSHAFKIKRCTAANTPAGSHPLQVLKDLVKDWLFNFHTIFARHIEAFRLADSAATSHARPGKLAGARLQRRGG